MGGWSRLISRMFLFAMSEEDGDFVKDMCFLFLDAIPRHCFYKARATRFARFV